MLVSAPAKVQWERNRLIICHNEEGICRLAVTPNLWINLWVEAAEPGLLTALEETLVWVCGATPIDENVPENVSWVVPLLASARSETRVVGRTILSAARECIAAIESGHFEAAGRAHRTTQDVAGNRYWLA